MALFAVLINDIGDELPTPVGRSLFVDDLAVWYSASSPRLVSRQLQLAVTRLERWSAGNGLRFSTTKTVAVHFCRRRCADPHLGIRLYGQPIPTQPAAKFLGVVFDRRLTYRDHFKVLRERCFRSLNVLKCVSRTRYGADRSTLMLLYRSIIRSKLDYACFVYDSASEASKRTLDTVHHHSLRVVTGAFRTSPTSSLLVEADEPPLLLRRQILGMRYALKLRQFPDHPAYSYAFSSELLSLFEGTASRYKPFCSRTKDLFAKSNLPMRSVMRVDSASSPPWESAIPQIDVSLSAVKKGDLLPLESRCRALEHLSSYGGYKFTFTDGSKTEEGVGCAFVSGNDTRSFSLPEHSSVFSAELVAIHKALSFIEVSDETSHLILSDSLSSLLALRLFNHDSPLIQDILKCLTSLGRDGKSVQFCWIPSHVGISGNEFADAAARRAAAAPCTRRLPLPARDFYPAAKSFAMSQWQRIWEDQRNNKLKDLKPTLKSWPSSCRRKRHEEVALCRLRIGHVYATHKYLLCGDDRPECPRCRVPLTVEHVLLRCPQHHASRRRHLGRITSDVTLRHLLGDDSVWIRTGSLFSYIMDIKFAVVYSPQ